MRKHAIACWRSLSRRVMHLILARGAALVSLQTVAAFGVEPAGQRPLIVGSELDFPPFALVRSDGEPNGYTVDLWRAVARDAHLNATIKTGPFHEILQQFRDGKVDVLINLAQSDARRQFADFSVTHISMYGAVFVREAHNGIATEADLADKSLIVLNADLPHDYAVARGWKNLTLVDDVATGMRLLDSSTRYDAMLVGRLVGLNTVKELRLRSITPLPLRLGFHQTFAFAVHKGETQLLERINDALANIRATGEAEALYEKWFGGLEPKRISLRWLLVVLLPTVGLLVLVSLTAVWIWRLKQRHQRSESLLAAALESTADGILVVSRNGHVTHMSAAFLKLWHVGSEIAATDDFNKLLNALSSQLHDPDEFRRMFQELSTNSEKCEFNVLNCKDGRHFEHFSKPQKLGDRIVGRVWSFRDVTGRHRAEEARQESALRLRSILDASTDHIVLLDCAGDILAYSSSFAEAYGNAVTGKNVFTLCPGEGVVKYKARFAQVVATGRGERYDERFGDRYLDVMFTPVEDGGGKVSSVLIISRDVTERNRAELALRESEARYRRAERGTNDGLWEWNIASGEEYFSPRWLAILGYASGDLPTTVETFRSLIHPDDWNSVVAAADRHRSRDEPFDVEMRLRRKDDSYVWVRSRGRSERDAEGKPVIMAGSITDISESKCATAALLRERDRLRQILDSQFGFVAVLKLDGTVSEANQTPLKLMGLALEEVLGRAFWEIGWLESAAVPPTRAAIAAAGRGETVRGDITARFPKIGSREVDAVFSPLRDAAGQVINVIAFGVDITERKQAERALRTSENRYRRLHESMNDAFVEVDMAGRLVEWNHAYEAMLGCAPEEIQRLTYVDLTPERWHAVELDNVRDQIQQRNYSNVCEKEYRRRDGTLIFVELRTFLLRDEAGAPAGMWAIVRDISERKRAEEILRISEERLRQAVRCAHIGIFDYDHRTNAIYWSPELRQIYGCSEAVPGTLSNYFDLLHPEHLAEISEAVRQAHDPAGNGQLEAELRIIRRNDGEVRWLTTRSRTFFAGVGAARHLWRTVGAVQDVTERKQAEASLRASEARLNEAQRIARVGSWELNLVSGKLHWSAEIFRLFELDPVNFGGTYEAFLNAVHPEDRGAVNAAYSGSLRDRKPYRIVHRLRPADGRIKYVEEQCETDFAPDGTPLASRGTVQDVTDRVLTEDAMRRSLREKETLLREIHHRVKNNLQIISSLMYFQSKKVSDAQALVVFGEVRDRLRSLMLVHERLYRSSDLADVDFADYVRSLVKQLTSPSSGIGDNTHFRVETVPLALPIESALPSGMILVELLTNVTKYAFPDGRPGEVFVQLTRSGDRVGVVVSDDGIGLPADFDLETTSTFGWQLILNLTLQLAGTITIEREVGTCVTVSFPLPDASASPNAPSAT